MVMRELTRFIFGILLVSFVAVFVSCNNVTRRNSAIKASKADSIIFDVGTTKNYDLVLALADSFEIAGDISPLNANRWRGVAYYHQGHYRMSEMYYRKALECEVKNSEDQLSYNKCARRLSELLLVKGDFEGALIIAIPAVKKMEESGIGSDIDYAILLNNIGCCQLNLGQEKEAHESFLRAVNIMPTAGSRTPRAEVSRRQCLERSIRVWPISIPVATLSRSIGLTVRRCC